MVWWECITEEKMRARFHSHQTNRHHIEVKSNETESNDDKTKISTWKKKHSPKRSVSRKTFPKNSLLVD